MLKFNDAYQNKTSINVLPVTDISFKVLHDHSTPIRLKRNDAFSKPVINKNVFIVSKGVVGLQHVLKDGRRTLSTLYFAGDIIDNRNGDITRCGTLAALTIIAGHWVDGSVCSRDPGQNTDLQAIFLQNIQNQNSYMIKHCADLGKKTALEKIAAFLFECSKRLRLNYKKSEIPLMLHRVDIADYLGLRQETLSRTIAKMEQQKLICTASSNHIRILNVISLRQIANGASANGHLSYN